MAQITHFSVAVLSRAASGSRLPSLAVVTAYVRACGEDPAPWEDRWREVWETTVEQTRDGEGDVRPPYQGLARFEVEDSDLFFGRDALVDRLHEMVCRHRLVGVVGPSGSGKSSLVRAGLVPAVTADAETAPAAIVITPGTTSAAEVSRYRTAGPVDNGRLLVVDQFEELFTLRADVQEREAFINELVALTQPGCRTRVVLAVRADMYGYCCLYPGLAETLSAATLLVGPMTEEDLREAVIRPARAAGLIVERELTARIVCDVAGRPGALPMLSHTLLQVWKRRRGRVLALDAYERLGGVQGALATTAESLYTGLTPGRAAAARRILLRLINPGDQGPDTRRPATLEEVSSGASAGGDMSVALQQLTDARMVTVAEGYVELAHEALIDGWPRLRDWLDADREILRQHRALTQAAASWQRDGHDPGALYRGSRLTLAEQLFAGPEGRDSLTGEEQQFLTAGIKARGAERRAAARGRRRLRALAAGLAALLVLAASIGYVAVRSGQEARRDQALADASRIAGIAQGMSTSDPVLADLLAVASFRVADTYESRSALVAMRNRPERPSVHLPAGWFRSSAVLTGDGQLAVTVDQGKANLLRIADGQRSSFSGVPDGTPKVIAVSPDGRTLVVGTETSTTVWNATRGSLRRIPASWSSVVAAFSGSGKTVALFDRAHDTLTVQDLETGAIRLRRILPGLAVVAVSPDDRAVVACVEGRPPQMWTIPTAGGRSRPLPLKPSGGCTTSSTLSFSRGGFRMALGTDTAGATVWDPRTGQVISTIPPAMTEVRLSPDGDYLLASDGGVSIWRVGDRRRVLSYQTVGQSPGAAVWVDDHTVRYLDGSVVRTLDVTHATQPAAEGPESTVGTTISPDGSMIIRTMPGPDGYDVSIQPVTGGPPAHVAVPLPSTADAYPLVSVSQDGGTVALGALAEAPNAWQHQVLLVDLRTGHPRTTLDIGAGDPIIGMTVSHDGRLVAVIRGPLQCQFGCTATGLQIWDVTGHALRAEAKGIVPLTFRFTLDSHWLATNVGIFDLEPVAAPDRRADGHTPSGDVPMPRRLLPDVDSIYFASSAASPDGNLIALADEAGRVLVRDAHTWALRATLNRPAGDDLWPQATGSFFQDIAFSRDSTMLASATSAGIDLWDLTQARHLGSTIPTKATDIQSIAFTPDGNNVIAANSTTVETIPITPTDIAQPLCTRAGRDLTPTEWQLYLPRQPFRSVCDVNSDSGPRD